MVVPILTNSVYMQVIGFNDKRSLSLNKKFEPNQEQRYQILNSVFAPYNSTNSVYFQLPNVNSYVPYCVHFFSGETTLAEFQSSPFIRCQTHDQNCDAICDLIRCVFDRVHILRNVYFEGFENWHKSRWNHHGISLLLSLMYDECVRVNVHVRGFHIRVSAHLNASSVTSLYTESSCDL